MTAETSPFIVGWQEWLALPDLGLPAIKAKIDTGARTSALHASQIEQFGPAAQPMVRFRVHPIPGRLDVGVTCSAVIVGRRQVTSSNGEKEARYFIRTPVAMGARTWDIEIGLTNRESMTYRMLLGRQAIREDMMVDAAASFRQPRLTYKVYRTVRRTRTVRRSLRVALVCHDLDSAFNRRLAAAAVERGHVLEAVELARLAFTFGEDVPGLLLDGAPLAHYDAVIPRVGRREGAVGAAVIRQLESMGCVALNPGDSIDRVLNRLAAAQALAREKVAQSLLTADAESAVPPRIFRTLVVGDEATAMLSVSMERVRWASLARHRAERRLAEHAAAALGLGLASVDIDPHHGRPLVRSISTRPALGRYARIAETDVASRIIEVVEERLRSRVRRAAVAGDAV